MKIAKSQLYKIPEYYLIVLIILAGYTPPLQLNPIAAVVAVILIFQIIFQNKLVEKIITSVFVLLNVLMVLAYISELKEFFSTSVNPTEFLLGGLCLLGINVFVISLMIKRYDWITNRMETSVRNPSDG